MELDTELAEQIVFHAKRVIQYPLNVMDADGIIIASTNPARRFQKHSGAVLALNQRTAIEITPDMSMEMRGTQPGVNLPIMFKNTIIGVIGISGHPDDIRHLGELVKMAAEMTVEHAYILEQSHWKEQRKKELILQWIDSKSEFHRIESQAIPLKIDLWQGLVACIIEVHSRNDLTKLRTIIKRWNSERLSVELSNYRLLLLIKASNGEKEWPQLKQFLSHELNFSYFAAVGKYYPSPQEMSASYHSAQAALNYGKRLYPQQHCFEFEQVKLPVILDSQRTPWQEQLLFEPLQRLDEVDPALKNTLTCWFENNLDNNKTAKQLFIHRNSLRYRLNKIGEICELDLDNHAHRVWLYVSLMLQ